MRKLEEIGALSQAEEDLFLPEWCDEAYVGLATNSSGDVVAVYDYGQLVLALMLHLDCSCEEAHEWVDLSILKVWAGPRAPLYFNVGETDYDRMRNDYRFGEIDYDRMRNDYRYHKLKEKEGW